jgi:nicotinamide-nucleotide amidase
MLNVSILTIGDEICIGQIINTNAAWIARRCSQIGYNVMAHSSVRDNMDEMLNELERLTDISDIIIVTGGLGPTHDDITKPALAKFYNDKIVHNEEALKYVKRFFAVREREMSERNQKQADIPSKAIPFENKNGTAPGLRFDENGKHLFALPGVPSEMKQLMEDSVLPFLKDKLHQTKDSVEVYKTLLTTGVPESTLADLIGEPDSFLNSGSLAFLPSYQGVRLRIGINAENINTAKSKLEHIEKYLYAKAGKYIFGENEDTLSAVVGRMLKKRNENVAVAESCTAGMLAAAFTDNSGSSSYFEGGMLVYSNEAKMKILGVKEQTLVEHGAVSEETALEMAAQIRQKLGTSYGIGITGIAGPTGGTEDKPVGTVWISIADKNDAYAKRYVFGSDRAVNRERSVGTALAMLYKQLKGIEE